MHPSLSFLTHIPVPSSPTFLPVSGFLLHVTLKQVCANVFGMKYVDTGRFGHALEMLKRAERYSRMDMFEGGIQNVLNQSSPTSGGARGGAGGGTGGRSYAEESQREIQELDK